MISRPRALRLKPLLDALLDREEIAARVPFDPVRFARRFTRPDDVEVSGLVAACLAYGRADQFGARLEELFARIGEHPGEFARGFQARRDAKVFRGIAYRFNGPADLAALVSAAGRVQNEQGSLGALFEKEYAREADLKKSLASFARALRDGVDPSVERALEPMRAFAHLVPEPARGGACKRLLLFLRWMVRGGPEDPIDFGLWKGVPASALVVPLDTHVARIAGCLGLTRRSDLSWATAEDVTGSLRAIDPDDPVKYDFALCHRGMSGACPRRRDRDLCAPCALARECRH